MFFRSNCKIETEQVTHQQQQHQHGWLLTRSICFRWIFWLWPKLRFCSTRPLHYVEFAAYFNIYSGLLTVTSKTLFIALHQCMEYSYRPLALLNALVLASRFNANFISVFNRLYVLHHPHLLLAFMVGRCFTSAWFPSKAHTMEYFHIRNCWFWWWQESTLQSSLLNIDSRLDFYHSLFRSSPQKKIVQFCHASFSMCRGIWSEILFNHPLGKLSWSIDPIVLVMPK